MAASGAARTTGGGDIGVTGASTDTTDAIGVGSLAMEHCDKSRGSCAGGSTAVYTGCSAASCEDRGLIVGLRCPCASLVVGESPRSLHGIQQSFQETKSETPNRAKPQAVTTSDSRLTETSEKATRETEMKVLQISICFQNGITSEVKRKPWCIQRVELALCKLFPFSFPQRD